MKTSPGCQVADSGDECDMSPSSDSMYWDSARSKEKVSLEIRDDGGAGIPIWSSSRLVENWDLDVVGVELPRSK